MNEAFKNFIEQLSEYFTREGIFFEKGEENNLTIKTISFMEENNIMDIIETQAFFYNKENETPVTFLITTDINKIILSLN